MATHSPYDLHDHSGARWLATAGLGFLFAILTAFLMFAYPHV